jgi:hypothetical protein
MKLSPKTETLRTRTFSNPLKPLKSKVFVSLILS